MSSMSNLVDKRLVRPFGSRILEETTIRVKAFSTKIDLDHAVPNLWRAGRKRMSDDDFPDLEDFRRGRKPLLEKKYAQFGPYYATLHEHKVVLTDDVEVWADALGNPERTLEQTKVNQYWISTVFLGLNHNHWFGGPPLWFETMVFEGEGEQIKSDRFCRRYTTWDEAMAGHKAIVEIIR